MGENEKIRGARATIVLDEAEQSAETTGEPLSTRGEYTVKLKSQSGEIDQLKRYIQARANAMSRSSGATVGHGMGGKRSKVHAMGLATLTARAAEELLPPALPPVVCTHSFGLAGGFSGCSVCGKRAVRAEVKP